jgi:hypothetical protein
MSIARQVFDKSGLKPESWPDFYLGWTAKEEWLANIVEVVKQKYPTPNNQDEPYTDSTLAPNPHYFAAPKPNLTG